MRSLRYLLASTVLAAIAPTSAQALDFQYYAYGGTYNFGGSPNTFAAGGGGFFDPYFTYTATENQIIYQYVGPVTWSDSVTSLDQDGLFIRNGSLLFNFAGPIGGVSIDGSSTGLGAFGLGNVTFNANAVAVEWANLSFDQGTRIVLNLDVGAGAVPEPATWALLLLGFGSLGAAMRSAKRRQTLAVSYS